MSNQYIKNALNAARRNMKEALSDLEENADGYRSNLRYHQRNAKYYKERLAEVNKRKRSLRRQIAKSDEISLELNPIKNIQKAKVAKDE